MSFSSTDMTKESDQIDATITDKAVNENDTEKDEIEKTTTTTSPSRSEIPQSLQQFLAKADEEDAESRPTISKKERKRMAKHALFLETRKERRAAEKRRRKEAGQKRSRVRDTLHLRHTVAEPDSAANPGKPPPRHLEPEIIPGPTLTIDCSWDHLMNWRDINSLVSQLARSYACHRRAPKLPPFHISSLGGATWTRMQEIAGYTEWKNVEYRKNSSLLESYLIDRAKIVYLTAESDNTLEELDPDLIYVIGGLVDHNHHKGVCHQFAISNNLATASLPLSQYVDMSTRKVLTVCHVFEILMNKINGKSWQESIVEVLPRRKQATAKNLKESQLENTEDKPNSLLD